MTRQRICFLMLIAVVLLAQPAVVIRAEVSGPDQEALKSKYVNKVLIFRKGFRMVRHLDVAQDGTVTGGTAPGFWSVDGAVQVNALAFDKESVTFKCAKLWANIKKDGQLHFFPAEVALKGKSGYPANEEIVFHTSNEIVPADQIRDRVARLFLGEQDSPLNSTPQPIAAYIQKIAPPV